MIFVWWGSEWGRWARVSQKENLTKPFFKKTWAVAPHLPLISQPHKSHKYLSLPLDQLVKGFSSLLFFISTQTQTQAHPQTLLSTSLFHSLTSAHPNTSIVVFRVSLQLEKLYSNL